MKSGLSHHEVIKIVIPTGAQQSGGIHTNFTIIQHLLLETLIWIPRLRSG